METLVAPARWLAYVADLIIGHDPWLAGLIGWAVGLSICPGYMYLLAVVSEWRWPRYSEQFKAFMPGNLYLSAVLGASAYLASAQRANGMKLGLYQEPHWTWIPFAVALLTVVALSVLDIVSSFSYKPGDTDKYHWQQLVSWTKVWHNVVVYGAYGFLLVRLGVPGVVSAPVDLSLHGAVSCLMRLILVMALIQWVKYLKADIKEPKHSTGHVRVSFWQWLVGLLVVLATFVGLAYAI